MRNDLISKNTLLKPLLKHMKESDNSELKEIYKLFVGYISSCPSDKSLDKSIAAIDKAATQTLDIILAEDISKNLNNESELHYGDFERGVLHGYSEAEKIIKRAFIEK